MTSTESAPRDDGRRARSRTDVRSSVVEYRTFHADHSSAKEEARKEDYRRMVNDLYFNLVTDLYEVGWGKSFHFAPRRRGESFHGSLARLEQRVADALEVGPGKDVIDVGCGVGGPMMQIARACRARIDGINLSEIQIERGRAHVRRAGLAEQCRFTRGDYMAMPHADASFDAAYTLCAVPHAPDKRRVYGEIARVLKPGAILAGTDWCMTSRYDPSLRLHRDIKQRIQLGSALPGIDTMEELQAHLGAHFEIQTFRDVALECDPETPWYLTLSSGERSLRGLAATPVGRRVTQAIARAMEALRLAPRGTADVAEFLSEGADGLVEGGESGIFTVVYFVARKAG